jgi:predicted ATPase
MSAAFLTWVRAHDGDLDAGRAAERRALEICAALGGHPGTRGFVECVLASNHNLLGDYAKAADYAESVTRLGQEQGMPHWAAQGAINLGWSLAGRGQCDSAVELIQGGIAGLRSVGTGAAMCYFHAALAEAELGRGRLAEALAALDAAHAHSAAGERYYDAELHRLRARVLLAEAGPDARDAAAIELNRAIASASKQGALRFAQLAANDLASLTRGATTTP